MDPITLTIAFLAVEFLFGVPITGTAAGAVRGAWQAGYADFRGRRAKEQAARRKRLMKTRWGRVRLAWGDTWRAALVGVVTGARSGARSGWAGRRDRRRKAIGWVGDRTRSGWRRINPIDEDPIEDDDPDPIAPDPIEADRPDPIVPVCITRGCDRARSDGDLRCAPCRSALGGDRTQPVQPKRSSRVEPEAAVDPARVAALIRLGWSRERAEAQAHAEAVTAARVRPGI